MSTKLQDHDLFVETYDAILTAYQDSVMDDSGKPKLQASPDPAPNIEPVATSNPPRTALEKCLEAHAMAKSAAEASQKPSQAVDEIAGAAFCKAIPPLRGRANIREFIDCVAHGMLINIIQPNQGSKLLYAAQVAYTATLGAKKIKNKAKTTPNQPSVYDWLMKQFPKKQ